MRIVKKKKTKQNSQQTINGSGIRSGISDLKSEQNGHTLKKKKKKNSYDHDDDDDACNRRNRFVSRARSPMQSTTILDEMQLKIRFAFAFEIRSTNSRLASVCVCGVCVCV